jgi:hypothetical protein
MGSDPSRVIMQYCLSELSSKKWSTENHVWVRAGKNGK